jgi:transcriptional regulator with XRE-family HTH domain
VLVYEAIGRRVRAKRLELRLTQSELARLTPGVSRTSIANLENGRQKLPLEQLVMLANALSLDDYRDLLPAPDELVGKAHGRVTQESILSDPNLAPFTAKVLHRLSAEKDFTPHRHASK